jgi:hypothetical protein
MSFQPPRLVEREKVGGFDEAACLFLGNHAAKLWLDPLPRPFGRQLGDGLQATLN